MLKLTRTDSIMAGKFQPKIPVNLDPPKEDPISAEQLARADGKLRPGYDEMLPTLRPHIMLGQTRRGHGLGRWSFLRDIWQHVQAGPVPSMRFLHLVMPLVNDHAGSQSRFPHSS